ncbi:MAG: PAS domain S-box protein [Magnetospirillum sp.]|nr:PAS domain S-box protein [Magnetospirillum sp.]
MAATYVAAAKVGDLLPPVQNTLPPSWLAAGVGLMALVVRGPALWPGIWLGAFAAAALEMPPLAAVAIASGSAGEAVAGAWLLRRAGVGAPLDQVRQVGLFCLLGPGMSPLVGATVGAAGVCAAGIAPWTAFPAHWAAWWLSDSVAQLAFAPLLMTWSTPIRWQWDVRRIVEAASLAVIVVVSSVLAFGDAFPPFGDHQPTAFFAFPALIWAALRFGPRGAALSSALASGIAAWLTVQGRGPFAAAGFADGLGLLSTFAAAAVVVPLLIGAIMAERRRALAEAWSAQTRLRAIVDTAVDAFVVIDERGKMLAFNPAAERIFGYGAAEAVGQDVTLLMPEAERPRHSGALARYRRTGEKRVIGIGREVQGRRKDGTTFPLDLAIAEWFDGGRRYFTGMMRDITARKEAEAEIARARDEALAAKAEAERASVAKSKFLAAASHDLRQPVQSLILLSSLLRERTAGSSLTQIVAPLDQSIAALNGMLGGLLDVSRLDAGVVEAHVEDLALHDLVGRLAAEYTSLAGQKGLRLRWHCPRSHVRTDPQLIERILRNLLDNALKYTRSGGILVGCRRRGGEWRVDVVDTGVGISDTHLDGIFEEFFQVDNPARDRTKGLGLGLSIVRRLARLIGGRVGVASRPGRGSRFSLTLPSAESAMPRLPQAAPQEVGHTRLILIVDDEPIIRLSLQLLLEGWGHRVVTAANADEAILRADETDCRLNAILADYRLGESMTGVDVVQAIHRRCGRAIPAVIVTGDTARERIQEVQRSGLGIMHKPVAADELKATVAHLLCRAS